MAKYIEDIRHKWDFWSSIDPPHLSSDPRYFEFFLIYRLHMEQVKAPKGKRTFMAPDHNGQLWPALSWTEASWLQFKNKYLKLVLDVWDKAFLLIPPATYDGFIYPQGGRRRELLCRLRLKIVDSSKDADGSVQVVRLAATSEKFFRSDSSLYDSGDVKLRRHRYPKEGVSFLHNTPAHEFGHLLGLWHVGAADTKCVEEGQECYGTNLIDRMNVMGSGSSLDLANALPWLKRVTQHAEGTKRSDWKADWASGEAALRGFYDLKVEKSNQAVRRPDPTLIDL